MEITLTSKNYDEVVNGAAGVVLIDFWASWCGPCKMIAPVVEKLAHEHPEITVCKVNVDEEGALAERFSVKYIPMLAVLKDGKLIKSESGYKDDAELYRFVSEI